MKNLIVDIIEINVNDHDFFPALKCIEVTVIVQFLLNLSGVLLVLPCYLYFYNYSCSAFQIIQ